MESAEKLSVTVTPAMARMIRIRAALRAFQREEEEHAERMASIRARVKASIEDRRPAVPLEEASDRVKSRISQLARDNDDTTSRCRS
jgi:antitoxin ParD1/3/4